MSLLLLVAAGWRGFMLHVELGPDLPSGDLSVEVTSPRGFRRTVTPRDDGISPDLDARDRRWSATVNDFADEAFELRIVAGGATWTAAGTFPEGLYEPVVTAVPHPDGTVTLGFANAGLSTGPGDTTVARGTLPFRFGWLGWLLLLGMAGGGVALARRLRTWRLPAVAPGTGVWTGEAPTDRPLVWVGPARGPDVVAPPGALPQEVLALAARHGADVVVTDPSAMDPLDERPPLEALRALARQGGRP